MPLTVVRQDITQMKVDAIVNAANANLQMGGGVCGAIFRAAGAAQLQAACDKLAPIKTGDAVITPGFALHARYIIHAVGPIYNQAQAAESAKLLRMAYTNALQLAVENQLESIAFPLLSSGVYGYPKQEAWRVATSAIQDFLGSHDLDVYLAVFDMSLAVSEELLGEVAAYVKEHYLQKRKVARSDLLHVELRGLAEDQLINISHRDLG